MSLVLSSSPPPAVPFLLCVSLTPSSRPPRSVLFDLLLLGEFLRLSLRKKEKSQNQAPRGGSGGLPVSRAQRLPVRGSGFRAWGGASSASPFPASCPECPRSRSHPGDAWRPGNRAQVSVVRASGPFPPCVLPLQGRPFVRRPVSAGTGVLPLTSVTLDASCVKVPWTRTQRISRVSRRAVSTEFRRGWWTIRKRSRPL